MRSIGFILLAVWLVLTGLMAITSFKFESSALIMGLLALAAGVLLVVEQRPVRRGGNARAAWGGVRIGIVLLAIWLILTGLLAVFGLTFAGAPLLMALLAIAAGVALIIRP